MTQRTSGLRGRPYPRRGEGGFALVLAVIVVALAAGAIGVAVAANARARGAGSSMLAARTLECGHGGTARGKVALLNLFRGGSSIDDVIAASAGAGGIVNDNMSPGTVNVAFLDNDDGDGDPTADLDLWTVMRSTCRLDSATAVVEVMGRGTLASAFNGAMCGCSVIDFSGAAVNTDSYDSIAGIYDPILNNGTKGNLQGNGDVYVTGTVDGDVIATGDVDGSGTVTGSVFAGGSVDTANITILGGTFQNMNPPPQPCRCSGGIDIAAATADAAASNDNASALSCAPYINPVTNAFSIGGLSTCVLSSGTYYFESFRITGTASVIIDPTLDPTDPTDNVIIYFDGSGPFTITGTGLVNGTQNSLNLEIYSNSTADINLGGTGDYSGLLYAPFSSVDIGGNTEIYGGLFSDDVQNTGSTELHFDENLLARQDFLAEWRRRAGTWRILN